MQVRRRELDLDALLVVMFGVKMPEQGDRILGRQLKAAKVLGQQRADVGWDTFEELLISFIDEVVLIA